MSPLNDENAKIVPVDIFRAKALIKASQEAISTIKAIPLNVHTNKTILRELYEGLRQYCEALGYLKGYKFRSHEVITTFLTTELQETTIAQEFDRYRKLRNGINYYGHDIAQETVQDALKRIPKLIEELKKYE